MTLNKRYFMLVMLCLGLQSRARVTAQPRTPFTFALVSDTHVGSDNAAEDLGRTVRDINGISDIEFVIISGDITEFGSDRELKEAKDILDRLNKPWYIIPGNHDAKWSESGTNSFRKIFGSDRFSFKTHGMLFIGCGSGPNMRMAPGQVPHEDIVWLHSKLDTLSREQPVVFVNHYPLDKGLANWFAVLDMLKQENTQAILCGHGHRNKAFDFEGIPGTMGRSNLRAKKKFGGYNEVVVTDGKMVFSERTPGVQTAKPWRTIELQKHDFEHDTASYPRPSYAVNDRYDNVHVAWSVQDSSDIGAGVILAGDLAIYPNTAGYLVARDKDTGKKVWQFKTSGKIYATPAARAGYTVFASTDSTIYCLDTRKGILRWKVRTGKSIVASPIIDGKTIYIGSSEGKFRAFSLKDGRLRWENSSIRGFIESRPTVDKSRVYFGSWGNHFYALDKKTGKTVWQWTAGHTNRMYSPAAVFPVEADGKIFIVAPDRYVTSLDAKTGREIWRSNKHKGRETIGISPDRKTVFIKAMQDSLFALSTQTDEMKLKWSLNCRFGYEIGPSPITVKEGVIFVPTDDGRIFAVDREKRKVLWVHKISNALVNYVWPIEKNAVLATTMDGKIVRLSYTRR